MSNLKHPIAVIDLETDPFKPFRIPVPFCAGYLDDEYGFRYFWGEDCITRLVDWLREIPPRVIYAHNGGKFDFLFPGMIENFGPKMQLINDRIVEGRMFLHTMRDSYAALPIPLSGYQKTEINYDKMEVENREQHKAEIISYLKDDCVFLKELVEGFINEFGNKLTIGGAAMTELRKHVKVDRATKDYDDRFRKFYFGGRTQAFEAGELVPRGLGTTWKVYDVNSMYPSVMRNYLHPIGKGVNVNDRITKKTIFATVKAKNYGALPIRLKDGGIDFNQESGVFHASIYEIEAGLDTGTLEIEKVIAAYDFLKTSTFADFIDSFFEKRLLAKANGDLMRDIFYKLIMNSSYGKFAQNPENFEEYRMVIQDEHFFPLHMQDPDVIEYMTERAHRHPSWPVHERYWSICREYDRVKIFSRPSQRKTYYNVATAASITGAARAELLRGLKLARRPIYCDTDSIICEGFHGDPDAKRLGAWKFEGEGDLAYIGGKKMYALWSEQPTPDEKKYPPAGGGHYVKWASKGVQLTPRQIIGVAQGKSIESTNPAPTFRIGKEPKFVTRTSRATVPSGLAVELGKVTRGRKSKREIE